MSNLTYIFNFVMNSFQIFMMELFFFLLFLYTSTDNGGPTDGTNNNMMNNFPLRSGKGETFEGGIRKKFFSFFFFIICTCILSLPNVPF